MAVADGLAALRRTTPAARLGWLQVVTRGLVPLEPRVGPDTGTAPRPARRHSHQGAINGRDLQRRVLLREVQGEAAGRRPGRGDQWPSYGQGQVPCVRDEPEPHPRQGLSHRYQHRRREGRPVRDGPPFAVPGRPSLSPAALRCPRPPFAVPARPSLSPADLPALGPVLTPAVVDVPKAVDG